MKINKLLVTSALILTLGVGVTACGPTGPAEPSVSPSPSVAPVTRVQVDSPDQVVVGVEYDLDDYVTVTGGPGAKVYEVEIPAASEGKVEVLGHKFKALEQGEFALTIKAGEKQSKFSTVALTQLQADFAEATGSLSTQWALHELLLDQSGNILGLAPSVVHRDDYTTFAEWTSNGEYGGFLLASNGNTYQYYIDGTTGEVVVDSKIQSNFGLYYCNMPWALSASDFEYVSGTDEVTGNTYEYLVMTNEVPCIQYEDQFSSQLEFFMYECAVALNENYYFSELTVEPFTITEGEGEEATEYETFLLTAYVNAVSTDKNAGAFYYVLDTRVEKTEVTPVREYIDEGNFPAPLDPTPAITGLTTLAASTSYTMLWQSAWINASNQPIESPIDPKYLAGNLPVGTEYVLGDATGVQHQYYGSNCQGVAIPQSTPCITGYNEVEGVVYNYTNEGVDAEENPVYGSTFTAEALPGVTLAQVLAVDGLGAFAAVANIVDPVCVGITEQSTYTMYTIQSVELLTTVLEATTLGYFFNYCLENAWQEDMRDIIDLNVIVTTSGSIQLQGVLQYNSNALYLFQMAFGNLGATTVTHPTYEIPAPTPAE